MKKEPSNVENRVFLPNYEEKIPLNNKLIRYASNNVPPTNTLTENFMTLSLEKVVCG